MNDFTTLDTVGETRVDILVKMAKSDLEYEH